MSDPTRADPIDILLVEDNPGDVRLILQTFREGRICKQIFVVEDGVEALALLRRAGKYGSVPRPDLILLDLNLPRKGGQELLAEVKQDPGLRRIPVVVVTSSQAEKDIIESYNNHANCYLVKPTGWEEFAGLVRSVEEFWLSVARLPPE